MEPRRPLYQEIKSRSLNLYKKACKYSQLHEQLGTTRAQLKFNMLCKRSNILPKSLIIRPPIRTPSGWRTARLMGRRFLCDIIQDNHFRINKYNNLINELNLDFAQSIPDLIEDLRTVVIRNLTSKYDHESERLTTKFQNLVGNQRRQYFNQNWVKNISSRTLNNDEIMVLGKGLKYTTINSNKDVINFIANVDNGIYRIKDLAEEEKYRLKQRVVSSITSIKNTSNLTVEDKRAIKSINDDESIKIVPADKGNTTVVIDTTDYSNKCDEHLSDQSTYIVVNENIAVNNFDPNKTLQAKVNRDLKELKSKSMITESEYKMLYSNTPLNALFYATIKIHKEGYPIRPIVSFIDSPTYQLAKFLSKLLTPTSNKAEQKLKNTNDVINCLQNFIVPDGFSLVSFDVKSLFTCIPQDLALESIRTAIDEDDTLMHRTNLDNESIMKLSELCVNANIF